MTAIATHSSRTAYTNGFTGAATKPPAVIVGANWQAGVSRNNEAVRPLLNGEAVPGVYAARTGDEGWVKLRRADRPEYLEDDPFSTNERTLRGVVTLVRVPRDLR